MIKRYISLTKPGIIMGNAITASGGFFLASRGAFDPVLYLAMLAGLSLIIASGCVINNYFDRDIDGLMERTKNRALVSGAMVPIAPWKAIFFAAALGVLGVWILYRYTNLLTLEVALFGAFVYIVLYTLWSKRRSTKSTFIGSLSGAVPPVIGYCAVTNTIDAAAILLFLILVLWQMPHFFAIALYRIEDYTAAAIPVLPVKKGILATKIQMILYINAFIVATLALTALDYTGYFYALVMAVLGIVWLVLAIMGFKAPDTKKWARRMFILSLVVIVTFPVMLAIDVR
ncbi:protoheme IX farnesyltransferase [Candidatus Kaiserbacteria bacterium]|nr:protoheme IX farnesyltransferase [Candidatus Kaiserbacteria bacterium]